MATIKLTHLIVTHILQSRTSVPYQVNGVIFECDYQYQYASAGRHGIIPCALAVNKFRRSE